MNCLTIEKMPHGGYVVFEGRRDPGCVCGPLFACGTIGAALSFIAGQIEPEKKAAFAGAGQAIGSALVQGAALGNCAGGAPKSLHEIA